MTLPVDPSQQQGQPPSEWQARCHQQPSQDASCKRDCCSTPVAMVPTSPHPITQERLFFMDVPTGNALGFTVIRTRKGSLPLPFFLPLPPFLLLPQFLSVLPHSLLFPCVHPVMLSLR